MIRLARPGRRRANPVGLTSLIDVVFILLLFFILTARLSPQAHLPLALGVSESSDSNPPNAALTLRLHTHHLQFAGQRGHDTDILEAAQRAWQAADSHPGQAPIRVVLAVDAEVSLQRLLSIQDALLARGLSAQRLETRLPPP